MVSQLVGGFWATVNYAKLVQKGALQIVIAWYICFLMSFAQSIPTWLHLKV